MQTLFVVSTFSILSISAVAAGSPTPGLPPNGMNGSFNRQESVLERFRSHTGKKDTTSLKQLFRHFDPAFTQTPEIVLSDGVAKAKVTIHLPGQGDHLPSFMVDGGRCSAVKENGNSEWVLDVVPTRGSTATSVTVLQGGNMTEYPLVVAPPLYLFSAVHTDTALVDFVTIANELVTSPGGQ